MEMGTCERDRHRALASEGGCVATGYARLFVSLHKSHYS